MSTWVLSKHLDKLYVEHLDKFPVELIQKLQWEQPSKLVKTILQELTLSVFIHESIPLATERFPKQLVEETPLNPWINFQNKMELEEFQEKLLEKFQEALSEEFPAELPEDFLYELLEEITDRLME